MNLRQHWWFGCRLVTLSLTTMPRHIHTSTAQLIHISTMPMIWSAEWNLKILCQPFLVWLGAEMTYSAGPWDCIHGLWMANQSPELTSLTNNRQDYHLSHQMNCQVSHLAHISSALSEAMWQVWGDCYFISHKSKMFCEVDTLQHIQFKIESKIFIQKIIYLKWKNNLSLRKQ